MARFDVYRNAGKHAETTPFLLDVQTDLLQGLDSRAVIPMRRLDCFPTVKLPADLMPVFEIDGMRCILETPKMASVPAKVLKTPCANLTDQQHRIVSALDMLFHGF